MSPHNNSSKGLLCGVLSALCFTANATGELLVQTTQGMVQGHINPVGVREWKGIRYGKAPMGELRFESPQAEPAYAEGTVYSADFDAPGCPQLCNLPPGNCPEYGQSEDCLFLNVFSPAEPSSDPNGYPVLFWIHGGAFTQGLGTCALYNGSTFAQPTSQEGTHQFGGAVTVAINYRLGALGFMASESMGGNYGFLDQRLALQWTIDNIAAFGGDPQRITMGGQSAGAMSVGAHLISPGTAGKNMFQKSIMESNPLALPYHDRKSAAANAQSVFEYVGCTADDVTCMKKQPVDAILEAQNNAIKLDFDSLLLNFLPFAPMVEPGGEIPEQPLTALASGKLEEITPMLQGSMYDEGQLFVYELFTKPLTERAYEVVVAGVMGVENGPEILRMYPYDNGSNSTDGRDALNVLATDLIFYCPLRNITRGYQAALGGATKVPSYIYRFDHILSFDAWGENYTFCVGYVCHGSELPFVFNVFNDGATVFYEPTADEVQLSKDLVGAWRNYLYTGNPNQGPAADAVPDWSAYPLYQSALDMLVVLEEPEVSTGAHQRKVRDEYCDMWDRIGYFY